MLLKLQRRCKQGHRICNTLKYVREYVTSSSEHFIPGGKIR